MSSDKLQEKKKSSMTIIFELKTTSGKRLGMDHKMTPLLKDLEVVVLSRSFPQLKVISHQQRDKIY